MVTRNQTDAQTLLHVFKEVLGREEDSDPLKALAQEGYNDIRGFLSIDDPDLANLTICETTEATIGDQVKQITRDKPLLKHHIGKMCSLSQWHRFMMAKTGKRLTNDEWYQLDKDTFDDFRIQYHPSSGLPPPSQASNISNALNAKPAAVLNFKRGINAEWYNLDKESFNDFHISNLHPSKPLPVALTSFPAPAVNVLKPFGQNLHLSALGGESPKPIQEVVTAYLECFGRGAQYPQDRHDAHLFPRGWH